MEVCPENSQHAEQLKQPMDEIRMIDRRKITTQCKVEAVSWIQLQAGVDANALSRWMHLPVFKQSENCLKTVNMLARIATSCVYLCRCNHAGRCLLQASTFGEAQHKLT